MGSKSVEISKKELLLKSVIYRVYTTVCELCIAYILKLLANIDVITWVVLINLIKLLTYFGFDLGWFNFIRKPGLLKKFKRWLGLNV
jgi:hypothetical protein